MYIPDNPFDHEDNQKFNDLQQALSQGFVKERTKRRGTSVGLPAHVHTIEDVRTAADQVELDKKAEAEQKEGLRIFKKQKKLDASNLQAQKLKEQIEAIQIAKEKLKAIKAAVTEAESRVTLLQKQEAEAKLRLQKPLQTKEKVMLVWRAVISGHLLQ